MNPVRIHPNRKAKIMCEDYPCCGHTPADPCTREWYDEPGAFDVTQNPHAFCEHEAGHYSCEDNGFDVDPDDCDHGDFSFTYSEDESMMLDRSCDWCYTDLPDARCED